MWALEAEALSAEAVLPDIAAAAQATAVLRLASAAYHTDGADNPPHTLYAPRILRDVEISQDVIGGLGLGGVAALTVGLLDLSDTDQFSADLARYSLADGRVATLRAVPVTDRMRGDWGTPLRDTAAWWTGTVRRIDRAPGRRARVSLGDITERLDVPLQPTRYAGTGGVEGGEELEGRPKPVTLGSVFNIAPVYLGNIDIGDGALPTYQAHWRAVEGIDAVRIRGAPQAATGSAPGVGEFRAWNSLGLFQIGASPDGDVGCDLRGDATGGYVNTTGNCLWRLLTSLGPQLVEGDRDLDSWLLAEADIPHAVGFHQGAEDTTAQAAAAAFLAGTGAVLAGGRAGTLRLFDPFARIDTLQFDIPWQWLVAEPVPVPLPAAFSPPPREVRVEWGRAWSGVSSAATTTPAALLERLTSGKAPSAAFASAIVAQRVAQHKSMLLPGLFADVVGAQARADAIGGWAEEAPQAWRIVTDRYLGQIELGHMGRFTWPGLGLDGGFIGVVVGWAEQAEARRLALTVVGVGV